MDLAPWLGATTLLPHVRTGVIGLTALGLGPGEMGRSGWGGMTVVPLATLAPVVANEVDLNESHSRLDEPARYQGRLAEDVTPITVARRLALGGDVEGPLRGRRGDQIEGSGIVRGEIPTRRRLLQRGQVLLEASQQ